MIVCEHDCCRIVHECRLHDFTWINRSLCQRAPEQLLTSDEPVLAVEKQHDEDFMGKLSDLQLQVIADSLGTGHRWPRCPQTLFEDGKGLPDDLILVGG